MASVDVVVAPVDVLIAEDDALLRASLRLLLEGEGYRCREANDGRTAVELALREPPRCAIVELSIPGLDGLAVARTLRAHPRTRGVHIHCLVGRDAEPPRNDAARAGDETCLTKPVEPTRLLQLVREVMQRPRAVRATGLNLEEAREQLDYWEGLGCTGLEAVYIDGEGFTVRGVLP